MKTKLDWNDLNLVRAIYEAGNLSAAARQMGVSHATAYRRLNALESQVGVRLFDRSRGGYAATPAGEEAADAARRIAEDVFQVERKLAGRDLRPSGTVRVTTTDTLFFGLLSPVFDGFRTAYPDIALEVAISNDRFNLSRREADIAIRPSTDPPENLVGRRIGRIAQAVYGNRHRFAGTLPDSAPWIGPDARMDYPALDRWFTRNGLGEACAYRIDTMLGIAAAVRDGSGLGVLPCYIGDAEADLIRVVPQIDDLETDLWILTHEDLRGIARHRAFTNHIVAAVKALADRLAGAP